MGEKSIGDKSGALKQQEFKENSKNGQVTRQSRKKAIFLAILLVVIIIGGSASFYYVTMSARYFSTDNAKVTAKMYTITPAMSGKLLEWQVKEGQRVEKNEVLGRQEVLPYITSPITGTVVKNNAAVDQMVSPATQLAVIADTDNLYIGVNIEETDIVKIQVGQTVDVKIDAYGNKIFKGVVDEIDRATQTYFSGTSSFSTSGTYTKVTQLIPVKVQIENPENLPLTFGMNASVKIHLGEKTVGQEEATDKKEPIDAKQGMDYSSFIEAADKIDVSPNVSGKVSKINVKVGQHVEQGEVLFVLDSADYALQAKQAAANILPAQTAYNEAAANYDRVKALYDAGAASQVELDGAKAKMETTLAQMEGAKTALEIAQKRLDDCLVKAPISGEVAVRNIIVGNMASPQSAALTLINAKNVIVHINVTETNISRVKIGTEAEIKVQATGAAGRGTVTSIAPAGDAKTGMFAVEISVNNSDGKFKPGMVTDVKLL